MAKLMDLPTKNELGYFEMRLESVGGLGANLAGQILAEALVMGHGFNGAHFSSYGSEKKGSPVKSFVRACRADREVRSSSPVERPHILVVFHECLLKLDGIASGILPDGKVVVNSYHEMDDVRNMLYLPSGTLGVVDALNIALEEKTRINTAILGAVVRVSGWMRPDVVRETIAEAFQSKHSSQVDANLRTFDRGFNEVRVQTYEDDGKFKPITTVSSEPLLGYRNAPIGGIIINPGNTGSKDLSASRQGLYPLYHRDRCIDCGLCTMTCPDYVFQWEKGMDKRGRPAMVLRGPNYQYCKGCMKCVEICPVDALTLECERPEFKYTADVQLWGPPDALGTMSRENEPAKWDPEEGHYWHRVG
ncbi:MAG: 2-oxoacid:acceptor oxidoreductase family protein [Deltaproteobacteria bacterium]|nr:2-oxoacid:acceptor oxidoreductase family protein [Deltaproteobacteria bacterium]